MVITKFKILDHELDRLVNFFVDEMKYGYECHSPHMTILAREAYHFRNQSRQLNCLVFKLENNRILVEVIAGGANRSIVGLVRSSEKSFAREVLKNLEFYAKAYQLEVHKSQ